MVKQEIKDTIDDFERRQAKYPPVADILREVYGQRDWRPHLSGMDELVSCILSQNTSDTNRDRAFDSLKARYPTWKAVVEAPTDELIDTIRSAGLS
jgi:endonuclease III